MDMANWQNYRSQVNGMPAVFTANIEDLGVYHGKHLSKVVQFTVPYQGDEDGLPNEDEYEKICSICHRPESKAGKMIQMGMGMYVCPDCMQRSMDTIMKGDFNYDEMMKLSKDMPGIHFMNMSDLMGDIPQKQKIKKKKEGEKKVPLINLKDIPAPHKIKEKLDEYVIGME